MSSTGPRITEHARLSPHIIATSNRISTLIEAARPLAQRAKRYGLRATAEQLTRIEAQLDVMRTVLVTEGEEHMTVARAYADVCEGRIAAHAAYIGMASNARA